MQHSNMILGVAISSILSLHGLRKGSLSESGGLAAFLVGVGLFSLNPAMGWILILFYLLGSRVSKVRQKEKEEQEEMIKSRRDAMQVLGCSISLLFACYMFSTAALYDVKAFASVFALASMGCCLGDTFASELGSVFGGPNPILITSFKRVPPGTNGAVSVVGTLASFLGGVLIGLSFYLLRLVYPLYLYQVPLSDSFFYTTILLGGGSGLVGSLIDSFLGATVQETRFNEKTRKIAASSNSKSRHISGMNLLSNEAVNLISSLLTGLLFAYFT